MQRKAIGEKPKYKLLRPRTFYYIVILALVSGLMIYGQLTRSTLELHVIHDRNPIFVTQKDGSIRNGYIIKILNKTHEDKTYKLELEGLEYKDIRIQGSKEIDPNNLNVFANSVGQFRIFVTADKMKERRKEIDFKITDLSNNLADTHETIFVSYK